MTFKKELFPLLVIILFLLPNLFAIVRGKEFFPFSNNPMFGHYITTKDSTASFSLSIKEKGAWRSFELREVGLWEIRTWRYYFTNVFGSSLPSSPQANTVNESEFIKKNTVFFNRLDTMLSQNHIEYDSIYIHLNHLDPSNEVFKQTLVGTYVKSQNMFRLQQNEN